MMYAYLRYGMICNQELHSQRWWLGVCRSCHTPFKLLPTVHRKYNSKIKFLGYTVCTYIINILLYHWSYYYSQSTVNAFHHRNSCSKYARWMSRFPNLRSSFQNHNAFFIKYILCREKFDQIRSLNLVFMASRPF